MNKILTLNELREKMHNNEAVKFTYNKKDGSERNAVGTLNEILIPKDHHIIDSSTNKQPLNFKYYDLEKNGWRSINKDASTVFIK